MYLASNFFILISFKPNFLRIHSFTKTCVCDLSCRILSSVILISWWGVISVSFFLVYKHRVTHLEIFWFTPTYNYCSDWLVVDYVLWTMFTETRLTYQQLRGRHQFGRGGTALKPKLPKLSWAWRHLELNGINYFSWTLKIDL